MSIHEWDQLRAFPQIWDSVDRRSDRVHESVFRSYQILREVKRMLDAGDSVETIRAFVRWAEDGRGSA